MITLITKWWRYNILEPLSYAVCIVLWFIPRNIKSGGEKKDSFWVIKYIPKKNKIRIFLMASSFLIIIMHIEQEESLLNGGSQ